MGNNMRITIRVIILSWGIIMAAARVWCVHLDRVPLPLELQDTSHDPEEVCINGQCEAEQD